jgi:hypothetical protein
MPDTRQSELEQLRAQLNELRLQMQQGNQQANPFVIPDPIKNMSEFSGNRRELSAWLEELDEIYGDYAIKGQNGAPDSLDSHYLRAIKNKIKGEARTILCANGNPKTIVGIKKILTENYGDQKDLSTNLTLLFHLKKGEKNNLKFFNDTKELNTRLKSNLHSNPMTTSELLDVITITKYLDNIGEPLASIIRQSNPKSLEAAYQAVCVNQNAETRTKPYRNFEKSRYESHAPKHGSPNYGGTSHSAKPYSKQTTERKPPTNRKIKVEANANEINDRASDTSEEEEEEEEEIVEDKEIQNDECGEVNFQRVRVKRMKT